MFGQFQINSPNGNFSLAAGLNPAANEQLEAVDERALVIVYLNSLLNLKFPSGGDRVCSSMAGDAYRCSPSCIGESGLWIVDFDEFRQKEANKRVTRTC